MKGVLLGRLPRLEKPADGLVYHCVLGVVQLVQRSADCGELLRGGEALSVKLPVHARACGAHKQGATAQRAQPCQVQLGNMT